MLRVAFTVIGSFADGVNFSFGSTTGTQIGTAATQLLSFWGATPIPRPAGAVQAALTNSTGGAAGTNLAACTATNSSDQSATINANFTAIYTLLNALRAAMLAEGLIKGSA